ncbi:hypothetical protein NN561_004872 [Cricetulus griseus]
MMKEWKNNPESDEDTKTDEKTKQPMKENSKSNQIRGNVLNVNNPSAKTAKQVGGTIVASSTAQHFPHWGPFVQLHHFTAGNKGLHHAAGEVLLPSKPCDLAAGPHI